MPDREVPEPPIPVRPLIPPIPSRVLIATGSFGRELPAVTVGRAIARGLIAGGGPEPWLFPIEAEQEDRGELLAALEAAGFDGRMRAARAVVVGAEQLGARTLSGSPLFEIATRARQAGVPAYAVTRMSTLDPFDARILDLQIVVEAASSRALVAAGRKLAGLV